ncbi:hypothetical protein JCM11491_006665 [Sporobolomyces phaffii]
MPAPRKSLFSSMASTEAHARLPEALLVWVRSLPATVRLVQHDTTTTTPTTPRKVDDLSDLMDGVVLGQVLLDIDSNHFQPLAAGLANSKALSENWVLRFNNLKRLYKLLIRYFEDVLSSSTTELHTPNLQLVAKGEGEAADEVCKLSGLVLALAVQSEHRLRYIEHIQSLDEWVQAELMYSIEQVMKKVQTVADRDKTLEIDADTEFYEIQHEKSRLMHDKESLEAAYADLRAEFDALKDDHADALATIADAEAAARDRGGAQSEKAKESAKTEQALKLEIDRLKNQLQTTANQLGEAEDSLARETVERSTLAARVAELAPVALEAAKLKDQLDEAKHLVDKSKKLENVLDKYKKKVEESGEWKRVIKTLEEENSELLDKNSVLQEELDKVSSSTSARANADQLKAQLAHAASRASELERANDRLEREVERTRGELADVRELRARERESVAVLEDKLREYEIGGKGKGTRAGDDDDDGSDDERVGTELDNALRATSTTDLKLRIRKLERELEHERRARGTTTAEADNEGPAEVALLRQRLSDASEQLESSRRRCAQLEERGAGSASSPSASGPKEDTAALISQVAALEDKLQKAKTFIKSQDKLLKAELSANYEEAVQSHLSEISQLRSDLSRQKAMAEELETNYQREHSLILSAWHDNAMRHLRQQVLTSPGTGATGGEREYQPQSWIKQQRVCANGKPLVSLPLSPPGLVLSY